MMRLPSINHFDKYRARAIWRQENGEPLPDLRCRAKPKIHGVSMTVSARSPRGGPDGMTVSSRLRRGEEPNEQNAPGYAAVMREIEESLWGDRVLAAGVTGIFGEWAGPGVQKKDAITRIDRPRLFVFGAFHVGIVGLRDVLDAAHLPDGERRDAMAKTKLLTSPETLSRILGPCPHVEIVPWLPGDFTAEGRSPERVAEVVERGNAVVEQFAARDPYVSSRFGVDAPGEGFVVMPVSEAFNQATLLDFAELSWKAKTDAHKVRASRRPVSEKTEIPEDAADLADRFVTEARVSQILHETFPGEGPEARGTGRFIAAMLADVRKEAAEEAALAGISDNDLRRAVTERARSAYLALITDRAPSP